MLPLRFASFVALRASRHIQPSGEKGCRGLRLGDSGRGFQGSVSVLGIVLDAFGLRAWVTFQDKENRARQRWTILATCVN